MLTYGGTEATAAVREAAETLALALFERERETLAFLEVAELERDAYGRVMVFVRVSDGDRETCLLLAFRSVADDGSFQAGPKCAMQVRESSFYAGLEHHRIRNSWNCPPDAIPEF